MAETTTMAAMPQTSPALSEPELTTPSPTPDATKETKRPSQPRIPPHQVYALPAPIRTFPLPTFYPSNPISLVHLVYAWVQQVISPPPAEPSVIHTGIWDPHSRSVHIQDPKSIRALWEQGFYGKGSLSRSEPNWLKREQNRRGALEGARVSEQHTESRREERRLLKWERAKAELEAIERQRQVEADGTAPAVEEVISEIPAVEEIVPEIKEDATQVATEETVINGYFGGPRAPVTPSDLLALPNSSVLERQDPPHIQHDSQAEVPVLNGHSEPRAPVTPADILALPNALIKKLVLEELVDSSFPHLSTPNENDTEWYAPVHPAGILALPNSLADIKAVSLATKLPSTQLNGHANGKLVNGNAQANGLVNGTSSRDYEASTSSASSAENHDIHLNGKGVNGVNGQANGVSYSVSSPPSNASTESRATPNKEPIPLKRRKSVRFSPQVESTTFQHTDPPSPNRSAGNSVRRTPSPVADVSNSTVTADTEALVPVPLTPSSESLTVSETPVSVPVGDLVDKEHFQLAPEEAFFLVFALGALSVVDSVTGKPFSTEHLLTLFRSYSYFPPREVDSLVASLLPSDTFLVQYAVYHHFRSLGWVPRHGIKFGVDFILYQRGPVFDHSEFGLIIIPAFSDPSWKDYEHETPKKTWSWMMGVNRVLSHVLKGLVLVYVDVPSPPVFDELIRKGGIAAALKKYTIREVMVRRFSVNRNR